MGLALHGHVRLGLLDDAAELLAPLGSLLEPHAQGGVLRDRQNGRLPGGPLHNPYSFYIYIISLQLLHTFI